MSVPLTVRNPFLRKGIALARRVPRAAKRMLADQDALLRNPPILANSFPKSGTHLLSQILEGFPGITNYGTFWASMPSVRFRERPPEVMNRKINKVAPGELATGHLFFDPAIARTLQRNSVVHFFIYRDPRDVVISEAHYLTHMNRWHRLHREFARQPTDEDRIMLSIAGNVHQGANYHYPDVARRFERYRRWLEDDSVFAVRFEDLRGDRRDETVLAMARHYAGCADRDLVPHRVADMGLESINPEESHTYRRGKAGGWRSVLTPKHQEKMKEIASQLLIDLGYEMDLDW